MDHLSSIDSSFLHFETPEMPMHVGSLMLFELPAGYKGDFYEDVKAVIAQRLHLVSIFHRKLAQMPFELADPVWIEDDEVDLDYHVRQLTLPRPGTMAQLEKLVARLHSSLLDRSRPLWEMFVIDGLQNGQVAFYTKAHHSGIDGKAGVELAKVLYDLTPEIRAVPPPRRRRVQQNYQLGMTELLQAAATNSAKQYMKAARLIPTALKAFSAAGNVIASRPPQFGKRSLDLGMAPKSIFNVAITNQRSFTTLSFPLDELKALGKRVGGTVNTVVMAMCGGALRRFLLERNELPTESLIAMVPVSLRGADDSSMNNQVSAIRVDLATDIDNMAERFKAVHASSESAKAVVRELKPVLGLDLPLQGAPWLMTGLANLFGRPDIVNRMPAFANVTISNVPGVPVQLYLAGAKMVHFYPVSIPAHSTALNITVQSCAGMMEFGLTACRRALSQEESTELIGYLKDALKEIEALDSVEPAATNGSSKRLSASDPSVIEGEVRAVAEEAPARRASRAALAGSGRPRARAVAKVTGRSGRQR